MEYPEAIECETKDPENEEMPIKEDLPMTRNQYTLKLNSTPYKLTIEHSSENTLSLKLRQIDNISYGYYSSKYNYEDIIKHLNLAKNEYVDIKKVIELFDKYQRWKDFFA